MKTISAILKPTSKMNNGVTIHNNETKGLKSKFWRMMLLKSRGVPTNGFFNIDLDFKNYDFFICENDDFTFTIKWRKRRNFFKRV
jgi:hypothetical protein